ncbi:hypothetical protein [Mycobacteroides abscessus]|nr:hypothetical protein I3U44_18485 [Mycobacteroides abscessus subsp. bolletii]
MQSLAKLRNELGIAHGNQHAAWHLQDTQGWP